MLVYGRSKYILALLVLLLSALYALPNIYPQDPSVQITPNRGAKIDAAFRQRVDATLKAAGVVPKKVEVQNGGELLVRLNTPDAQIRASDVLRDAVGSNYVVALNLASTVPGWLRAVGARPMLLGLDLQGGVHFLMQVDQKAALEKRFESYAEDLRVMLRENRIRYESVERRPDNSIVVTMAPGEKTDAAQALIAKNLPTLTNDVAGNTIVVRVPDSEIQKITTDAIEQNVGTLRNRINELGVAEPVIQRQGTDRVVVELPGVQDTAQAKRILGATATLEYRGVVEGNAYDAISSGNVPPEARVYYRKELGPDGKPVPILLNKRVIASGEQLVDAKSGYDSQSGTPMVSITLNGVGGQRMFDYTSQNVGKQMAVVYIERIPEVKVVDGKEVKTIRTSEQVINAATIQGVFSKQFQTTGLESPKEASDLALLLKGGALAAPMDVVEESVIGASLGQDNIDKGFKAVLLGLALVLLAAAIYYKLFGLVADIALFFNLVILVAVMSLIGVTLTMPGVAGIVLTLGMAIDANVLICERVREELRNGSSPHASIRAGYEKAWSTILDANVTHLIAALALTTMGTGAIKGFGVTLMIGILTSLFTSVTLTHAFTALIHGHRKLKTLSV